MREAQTNDIFIETSSQVTLLAFLIVSTRRISCVVFAGGGKLVPSQSNLSPPMSGRLVRETPFPDGDSLQLCRESLPRVAQFIGNTSLKLLEMISLSR